MPTNLAPTDLSSDTSHSPFVVSASTFLAPFDAWWAFRGDSGPGWIGTNNGVDWLQIDLGTPQTVGQYGFAAQESSNQLPTAWNFQGSNDGSTWTTLDEQSGVTAWAFNETHIFVLAAPAIFRYFRVSVTANNGGADTRIFNFTLNAASAPVFTPGSDMAPHTMGDNYSVAPYVAKSSQYYSTLDAWRAFNGNSTDVWLGQSGPPWWLELDLGYAQVLGSYSIQITLTGVGSPPYRGPGAWTMQGSNDGSAWTTVDTRSGIVWATEGQIQTFTCTTATTAYRYFRINITAGGAGNDGYMQVAELFLYAGSAPAPPAPIQPIMEIIT